MSKLSGRRGNLVLLVLGSTLSLLLGAGVFALASDSVTSAGNSAESGTYATPGHNLQAGERPDSSGCDTATYSDSLPMTLSLQNLGPADSGSFGRKDICLKNAGTTTGKLTVAVTNFSQTEMACSAGEFEAGDGSCGGGTGEFGHLVFQRVGVVPEAGTDPDCSEEATGGRFESGYSGRVLHASLAPGAFCLVAHTLQFTNQPVTEADRLMAQTDKIQWDLVFTLEDVPPPVA